MALQDEQDVKHAETTLREYLKRRQVIENTIAIGRMDLKELDEEFKDKLDLKTLKIAIRVAKAQNQVAHKFTFENILNILESEGWVDK